MNFLNLIPPVFAQIGDINPPTGPAKYITACGAAHPGCGLSLFISNLFKIAGVFAGIFVVFQIISAGYIYISASGDPKKFEQAGNKILQALLGLVIVSSAFVFAAALQYLVGFNPLNFTIYGPQ